MGSTDDKSIRTKIPGDGMGEIHIANEVIAELAGWAALESYGVVGMAARSKTAEVAQLLARDKLARGVDVAVGEGGALTIDIFVVIEYGTNLAEVAHNLIDRVAHVLTTNTGLPIATIDVHVQDIKVRE
jgi:uncharacterized alkaline shock family protein YloU